jgi:16S rRNA (uracil1498-N3)-methyltransferase
MIPRVFVPSENIRDNNAVIHGSDVNYLKNAMRLKPGDEITVIDGKNREFSSKIISLEKSSVNAKLIAEKLPAIGSKIKVAIAQGLPKNPKMDLIIQKATELGASKIIPVMTERSIMKIAEEKAGVKVSRWQRIAKEAAEQSGRSNMPTIDGITDFDAILRSRNEYDKCIMLWELEKEMTLKKFLQKNSAIKKLLVLIGPEGGFSRREAEHAKEKGFITVSIGSRILRTETAPLAVLSMIDYEFEL